MMVEQAISLVHGKPWTMAGNFLDTAVLWVSLARWSKESYGIQTMLYHTLGGIQLKHWTLSCAKDWAKPWTSLHDNHTIYNIGDQWAIIGPLKVLLILLLPTLFPKKDEVLQKTGLDELEFVEFFFAFLIEEFMNIPLLDGAYRRSAVPFRKNAVLLREEDNTAPIGTPLYKFHCRALERIRYTSIKVLEEIGAPTLFIRPDWTACPSSFLGYFLHRNRNRRMLYTKVRMPASVQSEELQMEVDSWFRSPSIPLLLEDNSPILSPQAVSGSSSRSASPSTSRPASRVRSPVRFPSPVQHSSVASSRSSVVVQGASPISSRSRSPVQVRDASPISSRSRSPLQSNMPAEPSLPTRVSRFDPRPSWNPSGYNPSPEQLADLRARGVIHMDVRHGEECTVGAGDDWRKFLSIREMLAVVPDKETIYQAVRDDPHLGLSWINTACPWRTTPSPTNFRFTYAKHYKAVRKLVEEAFPNIKVHNPHGFCRTRAGRRVRERAAEAIQRRQARRSRSRSRWTPGSSRASRR